jgi:hypothetical protein
MSITIQDLLREPPLMLIYDMGLGSRVQSMPIHDSEPVVVYAIDPAAPDAVPPA